MSAAVHAEPSDGLWQSHLSNDSAIATKPRRAWISPVRCSQIMTSLVGGAACLEQEPRVSASSMKFSRMLAVARRHACRPRRGLRASSARRLCCAHQFLQHVVRIDEPRVIVANALEFGDVSIERTVRPPILRTRSASCRSCRKSGHLAHRAADGNRGSGPLVPVEILGFQVKGKLSANYVQRGGNSLDALGDRSVGVSKLRVRVPMS